MNDRKKRRYYFHVFIGLTLMTAFFIFPSPTPEITIIGMRVLGVFIGTLYLWITVGSLWPSLLCVAALCFTGFGAGNGQSGADAVLSMFLGNPTIILIFFIMILSGALEIYGVTSWIAHRILNMNLLKHHPWRLVFAISLVCILMAAFANPFTPIFLFSPILDDIFEEAGYQKDIKPAQGGDPNALPKCMYILVVTSAVIGYAIPCYMGTPLVLVNMFQTLSEGKESIPTGGYLTVTFLTGFVMMLCCILVTRWIIRPDVSRLEKYQGSAFSNEKSEKKLNSRQKIISLLFFAMIVLMLFPSLVPQRGTIIPVLADAASAMPLIFTVILAVVILKDGPALDIKRTLGMKFGWDSFFLCAAAILLGKALTDDSTGISEFLKTSLSPAFMKIAPAIFPVLMILICVLITNFCNSLVVMMIMEPIIRAYCDLKGISGAAVTTLIMMAALMTALFTPAASPFAACLHGKKDWLERKDIYAITALYIGAETVVLLTAGRLLCCLLIHT